MFVVGVRRGFLSVFRRCLYNDTRQSLPKRRIQPKTSGIIGGVRCFGGINRWDEDLTSEIKKDIEKYWSSKVRDSLFDEENTDKEKFYILSMFPYPSGSLHMGHVRVYSISDVLARFFRMRGKNVFHPMGWDAFGLPAENAAIERGNDPEDWTQKNIANMKSLMEELNLTFDWNREFATCDSDYYKWTQFLFLKLYEKGLVYRKEGAVNWDPVDQTVLADEQVDKFGRSWRSGAVVEKKLLKQWFIKTTQFAKLLYDGLNDPALKNWKDVVNIQRHWIGKPNGITVRFEVVDETSGDEKKEIPIWFNYPEYVDRAKFVAVKPKSIWTFGCEENGPLPYRLRNPFTKELLPVYVTEAVEYAEGTSLRLGIPDLSEKDKELATSLKIPFTPGLQKNASKKELLQLREKICAEAREAGIGGYPVSSKLQDWLISRQRYWGTPIPMIYCQKCGEQPVPEDELPVKLPAIKSMKVGKNPLKEEENWLKVNCPKCKGEATRETDTMDTFVDSSWYFLRFLDPDNEKAGFGVEKAKKMMPVDVYVGGKEHACLHLYYARFMSYFLHSVNLIPEREPFKTLLCQGMVKARTYQIKETGEYVRPETVEKRDLNYVHKTSGQTVVVSWEKMSKSKHNGVEPRSLIEEIGVDATRMAVLGGSTPWSDLQWNKNAFKGILKWQTRLWRAVKRFIDVRKKNLVKTEPETEKFKTLDYYMFDSRNFYVEKITRLLENSFNVSTAIAKMQGLTSAMAKANDEIIAFSREYEKTLAVQIIMLNPLAPSFASELWSGFLKAPNRLSAAEDLLWDVPLHQQKWPTVDDNYEFRSSKVLNMLKLNKYKTKGEVREKKRLKKKLAAAGAAGSGAQVVDNGELEVSNSKEFGGGEMR